MTLREFRRPDGPGMFTLMTTQFPEEDAMLGMRPEGFEAIIRRLYRADFRLFLGFLRLVGRPAFRLYVVDEGGKIAGVTLLTFTERSGFLSSVVVGPEYRRRGLARALIEEARAATGRRGRKYVALRVLAKNAPARALYAAAGYLELDRQSYVVLDRAGDVTPPAPSTSIRPFRRPDARALAEVANRTLTATQREVLPVRPQNLYSGQWSDRLFQAQTSAWVIDRGHGAEAHVSATLTPATEAAHLSSPIVSETVEPALAAALVRTAVAWLAPRRPARIVSSAAEENTRGRAALTEVGFHEGIGFSTLYRPSA